MNFILISSFIAFLGTLLTMPIVIKLAIKKKILAQGGGRNSHEGFIPNTGGMAIFIGILLSNQYLFFYFFDSFKNFEVFSEFENQLKSYIIITGGVLVMFIIGLVDDIKELGIYFRFFIQTLISFLIVFFGDLRIDNFHGVLGFYQIPEAISIIFSVTVMIFIINSFNLTDGLDGLAASLGLFILSCFAIIFYSNANYLDCTFACIGISSLFSFWLFNRPPARIFMGDSGSLVIGYIIAYCAIRACNISIVDEIINPVFVLCILAYPSIDTLRIFIVRILSGKSPFLADRNHIHHLLIYKGFNHGWVSFFAVLYSAFLTSICFFLIDCPNISFFVMVCLAILFIYFPISSFARLKSLKFLSNFNS